MNVLQIKAAVRERDGYKCTECGMTNFEHILSSGKSLEVHRLNPGSKYAVEDCITLCKACHATKPKSPVRSGPIAILRVPISLARILEELAEENPGSNFTQEGLLAIREYLRSIGKMPRHK